MPADLGQDLSRANSQSSESTDYYMDAELSSAIEAGYFDDCVRPRTPVAQPDDDDSFHVSMQDPFAALQDLREKAQSLTDSSPARGKRRLESADESSSRIVKTPRVELVADVSSGRKLPQREDTDVSKPYVIADPHGLSATLSRIPWGVLWEMARLLPPSKAINDLFPDLSTLSSSHQDAAPRVPTIFLKMFKNSLSSEASPAQSNVDTMLNAKEAAVKNPWVELDLEDKVLSQNPFLGLGCNEIDLSPMLASPDWYGGKVHFTGRLSMSNGVYKFTLDKPYLGFSNRFTRRFGSGSFLRIRISSDLIYNKRTQADLVALFKRPLVIFTKVFRAFYAKDQSVFYFSTNETYNRPDVVPSERGLSLAQFLAWHNDIVINSSQTMAKWASRFALGLSNSVPGLRIHSNHLHRISDIISPLCQPGEEPSNNFIMTDGCGFGNATLFTQLQAKFSWHTYPTAIQCRIKGAKGLLVLHPDANNPQDPPTVWIRDSQSKIQYTSSLEDPAWYTLDVLRSSRLTTPANLSGETIINMAENGVDSQVFTSLMKLSIQARVLELLNWEGLNGNLKLWDRVACEGSVFSARFSRLLPGIARVLGQIRDDRQEEWRDEDGLDQLDAAEQEHSVAWWADPISGSPSSLEETVMRLLDAGFSPDKLQVLREKLKKVIKSVIDTYRTKFHIQVAESCCAFVIPDPCGVLEPGEVHIKSSSRNLITVDGQSTDIIMGDVLLTRHPCKVGSDVQKAVAVFKPELRQYHDVIIVSTKGHLVNGELLGRHLASMTGGGDYDGDTMHVFWNKDLLYGFKSADPSLADTPQSVMNSLDETYVKVSQFLEMTSTVSEENKISLMQDYLLGSLKNPAMVGKYSTWWENSIYSNGYFHPDTVRLAYLFCEALDSLKTGRTIKQQVYSLDAAKFNCEGPSYKISLSPNNKSKPDSNELPLRRGQGLHPFIMDILNIFIKHECDIQTKLVEDTLKNVPGFDIDLVAPWEDAWVRAEKACAERMLFDMKDQLKLIKEHVKKTYEKWQTNRGQVSKMAATKARSGSGSGSGSGGKSGFTNAPIEARQDALRKLSRYFSMFPERNKLECFSEREILTLKASYAYKFDYDIRAGSSVRWSRFPWDVALGELCAIKARAQGQCKTVSMDFYEAFKIHSRFRKSMT